MIDSIPTGHYAACNPEWPNSVTKSPLHPCQSKPSNPHKLLAAFRLEGSGFLGIDPAMTKDAQSNAIKLRIFAGEALKKIQTGSRSANWKRALP